MALSPDSNDSFTREVDENLRRDQMQEFARTYGIWLIAGVVLLLAAVGGWLYWQNHQRQETARQTEELHAVFGDIAAGRIDQVPQRLEGLKEARSDVVRASAILTQAAVALERNQRDQAIAGYRGLAGDASMPQIYRDAATIRGTAVEFDSLEPEEVIARLQPLAQAGNPWFGSAAEMTAMAYLRQNKTAEAGRLFAAIAADRQLPETLRSRAVQIAGTLGVDASASLPAPDQQD